MFIGVFLFSSTAYSIDLSKKSHLRKHLDFNAVTATPRYLCVLLAATYHNGILKYNLLPEEALARAMEEMNKSNTKETEIRVVQHKDGIWIYNKQENIYIVAYNNGEFGLKSKNEFNDANIIVVTGGQSDPDAILITDTITENRSELSKLNQMVEEFVTHFRETERDDVKISEQLKAISEFIIDNTLLIEDYQVYENLFDVISSYSDFNNSNEIQKDLFGIMYTQLIIGGQKNALMAFMKYINTRFSEKSSPALLFTFLTLTSSWASGSKDSGFFATTPFVLSEEEILAFTSLIDKKRTNLTNNQNLLLSSIFLSLVEENSYESTMDWIYNEFVSSQIAVFQGKAKEALPQDQMELQLHYKDTALSLLYIVQRLSLRPKKKEEMFTIFGEIARAEHDPITTGSISAGLTYHVDFLKLMGENSALYFSLLHEFCHLSYPADGPAEEFIADAFASAILEILGIDDSYAREFLRSDEEETIDSEGYLDEEHVKARVALDMCISNFIQIPGIEKGQLWQNFALLIDKAMQRNEVAGKISLEELVDRLTDIANRSDFALGTQKLIPLKESLEIKNNDLERSL